MLFFIIFAVVIFCVVYEESGQRRIPVQYAKRVVGRKVYGAQSTHIPFKINPSVHSILRCIIKGFVIKMQILH